MKFKIRIKNGKPVDFETYGEKEEYTPKFVEIEPLPQKEGFYIETYLDKTEAMVKQKYVEIPKSETEKLREELKKTNKALQEFLLSQEEDEE